MPDRDGARVSAMAPMSCPTSTIVEAEDVMPVVAAAVTRFVMVGGSRAAPKITPSEIITMPTRLFFPTPTPWNTSGIPARHRTAIAMNAKW